MSRKILLIILIAVVVIAAVVFVFWKYRTPEANKIILFSKESCPFCANVEQFIKDNKIEEKVSFEKKDVTNNQDNVAELFKLAEKCGLSQNEIGVPFLWDDAKCYIGDEDIINFFKQKAGIQ